MPSEKTGIQKALQLKTELLTSLRCEEAITSDAMKKFDLKKRMGDLEQEIEALKTQLNTENTSDSSDYTIHVHSSDGNFTKNISGINSNNPLEQHIHIGTNKDERIASPKKEIKTLIINGELSQAMESFLNLTEDTDEDLYDEVCLIASRFNPSQRNYEQGSITHEQHQLVQSQTSKSLMSLLKNLK